MAIVRFVAFIGAGLAFGVVLAMGTAMNPGTDGSADAADDAKGTTKLTSTVYSDAGYDITPLSQERIAELAKDLTDEERKILLHDGTEPPFCGTLLDNKKEGVYCCRLCGLPLYKSDSKFDSGSGWPAFFQPVDPAHIVVHKDTSYGMVRQEIVCARCGSHLGHVFDDAPQTPTGMRHCVNSASLVFYEKSDELPPESRQAPKGVAYFAGGCFWGIEHRFEMAPGVMDAISGYMGGHVENPTYKQVCTGKTGHTETVKVVYDTSKLSYEQLLTWFFKIHDATQVNRQGPDIGTQYRSAIFAVDDKQYEAARAFMEREQAKNPKYAKKRIATELASVKDAGKFYVAEDYHQDYHAVHGGSCSLPPIDD